MRWSAVCCTWVFLLCCWTTEGGEPRSLTPDQWRADGRQLAQLLREKHVDLIATISEEAFDAAVEDFLQGVEGWDKTRIRVELLRLAAVPSRGGRNGHTLIWPLQRAMGFSILPLKLYWFEEGLYVVAATERDRDLVGARVVRLGNADAARVRDSVSPLIGRDGPIGALRYGAFLSLIPEILQALGHAPSSRELPFELELPNGELVKREFEPISRSEPRSFSSAKRPAQPPTSTATPSSTA